MASRAAQVRLRSHIGLREIPPTERRGSGEKGRRNGNHVETLYASESIIIGGRLRLDSGDNIQWASHHNRQGGILMKEKKR